MRCVRLGGSGWRGDWRVWLLIALAVSMTASCARPKPQVAPDPGPALGIPAVPERVLASAPEPAEAEEPPATPPEPNTTPVRRPSRPRPVRTEPAPKPETPPETPPPPAVEPPAAPAVGAGLRTVETRDDVEATRRVRETLGRATTALGRVSVSSLGREARSQYDMAHRFIAQADEALRVRNFMLAAYLAGKAETIARELAR